MLKPADLLTWHADLGYGFYPVASEDMPYDAEYVKKYEVMSGTGMAHRLNTHRVALAQHAIEKGEQSHEASTVIDIGPGDGAFMRAMSEVMPEGEDFVFGFDVNPVMVSRLIEEKRFALPNAIVKEANKFWTVMTFWDSFEHIHRPDLSVQSARTVAMSIPIFENREHVLRSKHFRPDEHVWYFTHAGIQAFMKRCDFKCIHYDDAETRIGREDIKSYIFVRD